jgi:hypothetical protein
MKPGSRIVSFDFDMCSIVEPDRVIELEVPGITWFDGPKRKADIYLWKTPLKKDENAVRSWLPKIREFKREREKPPSKSGR